MPSRNKITTSSNDNHSSPAFVNARDMYEAAGIASNFGVWIKARIRHHLLVDGQDYVVLRLSSQPGYERAEYFITLRAAHNIANRMHSPAKQSRALAFLDRYIKAQVGEV